MFIKVRFKGSAGATSGLVVVAGRYTLQEISRMFPKMQRIEWSPEFEDQYDAIMYNFSLEA